MSGDPSSSPPGDGGGWLPPSDRDWSPPPEEAQRGPSPERPAPQQGAWPPTHGTGVKTTNGRATASLVLGILGLIVCPLILSVLALVFGYQSRKEIDASEGRQTNRGAATAGIVLGWVGLVLGIVLLVLFAFGLVAGLEEGLRESGPAEPAQPAVLLALLR